MAKGENQKLKMLYLLDILNNDTDENHPMTVAEMIARLNALDVSAERKSIYSDLDELRKYGADIIKTGGNNCGYYIASRLFELPELKLLVDAVQSSRFITSKKSDQLIRKVESLTGRYDAKKLQRQVYVSGRIKTMNESIYYNVDTLHTAIADGRKITFLYFEWQVDFSSPEKIRRSYRKGGAKYEVSPFALCWQNENYYLLAYDSEDEIIKCYRVDKMEKIEISADGRDGEKIYDRFDTAGFIRQRFGMFGGEKMSVKLCFENSLIGVAVDRFGTDAFFIPEDSDHFNLTADVVVSPQFFSWLFGLGGGVRIVSPQSVADKYNKMLSETLNSTDN